MLHRYRVAFFVHSMRSDWNNGNAHFLRGLARALAAMGHEVRCYEHESDWSIHHLTGVEGERGRASLAEFAASFPDLEVVTYSDDTEVLRRALRDADVAVVHEWHTPEFIATLLDLSEGLPCRMLFHDTHHRASSSPEQIARLQVSRFDGVLAFGEALRSIYRYRFGLSRVWTLHEAADTTVFFPQAAQKTADVVWVGNWGDDERSRELEEFLIAPAIALPEYSFQVYGVRYPADGLQALANAGIGFGGYLPNISAAAIYRAARLTLHVPRQQYAGAVTGIPTIRIFETLAAGIPLISAPWQDTEKLFRPGDFCTANSRREMIAAIAQLLENPRLAATQAEQGRRTVLDRHTCGHRAEELSAIFEEVLA